MDLRAAERFVDRLKGVVSRATRPEVLSGIGAFGGAFALQGYRQPVLVSSTDSVGTKLKLATFTGQYRSLGHDVVNQSLNDVLVSGALPLFFLDYIASNQVSDDDRIAMVEGVAEACAAAGCALIGGETADLPGVYQPGDFDFVGFVVGAVERDELIDGSHIRPGDALLGLPSSGLHTNGYALARQVMEVGLDGDARAERARLEQVYPELGGTLGAALMAPHRSYIPEVRPHLARLKGMAHITGGGLPGNLPRVLPDGVCARVRWGAWEVPPLFRLIQSRGGIALGEMLEVFNMGIGMVLIAGEADADALLAAIDGAVRLGDIGQSPADGTKFVLEGMP